MSKIKKNCKRLVSRYKKCALERRVVRKAREQYDALREKKDLSPEQKKEVIDFYKSLTGIKVPLIWHKLYLSKTGKFDKRVLPTTLYRFDLTYKANNDKYRDAYADKNMLDIIFPNVKCPKPILKNRNGYYYFEGRPVTKDEAIQNCWNLKGCIIKPTLLCEGQGVRKLNVENGVSNIDGLTIEELFDSYKENFQIQECIIQHENLAKLNPSSLNTIRTVTYRSGMEVIVLFSSIRIGRMGSEVDNLNNGGISSVINDDGTLGKYGYLLGDEDRCEVTDSGVVLDGYKVPSYEKIISFVKELQLHLPFFNLVGWDVTIDQYGEPVLIEWNARTGFSQFSYGPAFGENTERIIKELWNKKNTRNSDW